MLILDVGVGTLRRVPVDDRGWHLRSERRRRVTLTWMVRISTARLWISTCRDIKRESRQKDLTRNQRDTAGRTRNTLEHGHGHASSSILRRRPTVTMQPNHDEERSSSSSSNHQHGDVPSSILRKGSTVTTQPPSVVRRRSTFATQSNYDDEKKQEQQKRQWKGERSRLRVKLRPDSKERAIGTKQ